LTTKCDLSYNHFSRLRHVIEASPYFSPQPHTLYAESNHDRDRSPMGLH
jgi:hypothetical protein